MVFCHIPLMVGNDAYWGAKVRQKDHILIRRVVIQPWSTWRMSSRCVSFMCVLVKKCVHNWSCGLSLGSEDLLCSSTRSSFSDRATDDQCQKLGTMTCVTQYHIYNINQLVAQWGSIYVATCSKIDDPPWCQDDAFPVFINHDVMFTYLNFGKLRRVAFPMGAYGAPTLKMTVLLEQK